MCNVLSFHISNDGQSIYPGDCKHHENGVRIHGLKVDDAREGEWTADDNGASLTVRDLPPEHRPQGQELYDESWYKACILSRWKTRAEFVNYCMTRLTRKVGGDLDLCGCTGLTALPEGLKVGGYLDLRSCTGLTALPKGLKVGGYLDLRGCTGLTALPKDLKVGGVLDLCGCTGLTALPEGLKVGGEIVR